MILFYFNIKVLEKGLVILKTLHKTLCSIFDMKKVHRYKLQKQRFQHIRKDQIIYRTFIIIHCRRLKNCNMIGTKCAIT